MTNSSFCSDPDDDQAILWVRIVIIIGYVIIFGVAVGLFVRGVRRVQASTSFLTVAGTRWCTGAAGLPNVRRQQMLLAWRTVAFAWAIFVTAHMYVFDHNLKWKLCYYTIWNYHLQLLFWGCAFAASARWVLRPQRAPEASCGWLRELVSGLCVVCTPASVLVSILLWGVLFPHAAKEGDYSDLSFESFCMHLVNTVLLLLEFGLNRVPIRAHQLLLMLCWALSYAVFSWVQRPFTHCWPYFFLKLNSPAAIAWYVAVGGVHVLVFLAACWVSSCKERRLAPLLEGEAEGSMSAVLVQPQPEASVPK